MLEELRPVAERILTLPLIQAVALLMLAWRHFALHRRHRRAKEALARVRADRGRLSIELSILRASENPGPASAGPGLPNPAGLPGPAGVAAGSKSDSGTLPAGTGD